jgi:CO/xanthine dehydrogenase FAD-binding subunit
MRERPVGAISSDRTISTCLRACLPDPVEATEENLQRTEDFGDPSGRRHFSRVCSTRFPWAALLTSLLMEPNGYHRPRSLREALSRMAETPNARLIAGGTDLLVQQRKAKPRVAVPLISLRSVPELLCMDVDGDRLRIGSAVPLTDVAAWQGMCERFPVLVDSIRVLGSRQIRNVATLGGNLCNASPAADTAPALLVLHACVELVGLGGTRELPLADFLCGPGQTALQPGEILTAVILPAPPAGARMAFLRKGRVQMDLAIVILAVLLLMDDDVCVDARVAAGAVAPVPLRLGEAESILRGSQLDDATIDRARVAVGPAIAPISDLRSSAEYRRQLLSVYVKRGVLAAARGLEAAHGEEGLS